MKLFLSTCTSLLLLISLWAFSTSYGAVDADQDGIFDDANLPDDQRDRFVDPFPQVEEQKYVCTKIDIDLHIAARIGFVEYGCIDSTLSFQQVQDDPYHMLGIFSLAKRELRVDSDRDSVKDFEDRQKLTPEHQRRYVCTQEDIDKHILNRVGFISYGCFNESQLGVYSTTKQNYILGDSLGTPSGAVVEGNQIQNGWLNLDTGEVHKWEQRNDPLKELWSGEKRFWNTNNDGERGIVDVLMSAARDLKNIFFAVASVFFLYLVLRLLFSENGDEDTKKFKDGIMWITIGMVVMQISYTFVTVIYDKWLGSWVADGVIENIILPLTLLLQTLASFFFIAMGVIAFYQLIASSGEEQAATQAKSTVINAILGFLLVQLAELITSAVYSGSSNVAVDPNSFSNVIITIINWMNGFVWIAVIVMIIYAGAQILLSGGDEEKLTNGKKALLYIAGWITLLFTNFLILIFFFQPSSAII